MHQCLGTDLDPDHHHDVPGAVRSGESIRRIPADHACYIHINPSRYFSGLRTAEDQYPPTEPNPVFGGLGLFIGGLVWLFNSMEQEQVSLYSTLFANTLLFTIICGFIISGMRKKINVYDAFIEGAKEGFQTAITIIPYLVAILVGIGVFRASGAMDFIIQGVRFGIASIGLNTDFVEALPTMLMKPLSGSGARGMMLDAMNTYGADSFVGRLSSIVQGSCDTTFYVVALYYGSVGIRNTRYTVQCALLADLAGAIAAITMAYLFF